MDYVIGVDGGGSRLRVVLTQPHGAYLASAVGGAANPQDVGWEGLGQAWHTVYAQALRSSQEHLGRPLAAVCGLAGVASAEDRERARELLCERAALSRALMHVVPDYEIAWQSAFGQESGIALIAGTGSIAYGRTAQGRTARAGGHGPRFDDGGSATWIARSALAAIARASDGRAQPTLLTDTVCDALGCSDFAALKARLGRQDLERRELAQLARPVERAAAQGDSAARAIVAAAASELASCVSAVAASLVLTAPALSWHGGLLETTNVLHGELERALDRQLPSWQRRHCELVPVAGAARLAAARCGAVWDQSTILRLAQCLRAG